MALPSAIFFDLDDTLICYDGVSLPTWQRCCREVVARFALPITADNLWAGVKAEKDWFWSDPERHRLGRLNDRQSQRTVVTQAFEKLGLKAPEAALWLADTYSHERIEAIHLFPHSLETLAALRQRGVRLALLTNGMAALQRGKIERFGLAPYFEAILIEEELGFGKPDPRVFTRALDWLNLEASAVWMVGDNLGWDVGAPQQLGIVGIWHDCRGSGLPADSTVVPDRIIRDVGELLG